jgi:hypothetical protein
MKAATRGGALRTDPVHREGRVLTALLIMAAVSLFGTCAAVGSGLFG